MARPVNPNAQYTIKLHVTNGYTYASTQPPYLDPKTGKKKYRYVHWGAVDENRKFIPGTRYYQASPEERAQLIFPEDWDMSEAEKLKERAEVGMPSYSDAYQNRLYGDIWLLEQVALKTGIREDLETIFNGNQEIVDDILTLAMFPYLTKFNFSRVARWQKTTRTPSSKELSSVAITRLSQSITEQHRMSLLRLRAARLGKEELCAVDSTSRSAYGSGLADIRWGKNRERLPLAQTTEVVVYSLSSHMPVYYRTFPGNMPDSRMLAVIFADLEHAGFKDLVLITDRGFETLDNLEKYILRGQPMVMCTKTSQQIVLKEILGLGEFGTRPEEMEVDPEERIYYRQFDIDYEIKITEDSVKKADRMKLNLYFDPVRRSLELVELDIALKFQKASLVKFMEDKEFPGDVKTVKSDHPYYKVSLDPATKTVRSFVLDEKKVAKARSLSGFFSIMTHAVDFDAMETFHTYSLRDEQEKYFQQKKNQMMGDRQRNWSEEGKTGRLFILFVGLVLSSWVRHVWKSTRLKDLFSSSLDILDEMRPIRFIEQSNQTMITPFVGAQIDICDAFGFDIPENCAPINIRLQKPKRKRGRPRKKMSQKSL